LGEKIVNTEEKDLIEQIKSAFADVKLDDGVSLNVTEYYDSGGTVEAFREKAKFDERLNWAAIPDETLEQFTVTFSFTDLKGYRFYIPAYMIYNVRNRETSNSIITEFTIYALDIDRYQFRDSPFVDFFTTSQLEAICSFLEWESRNEGGFGEATANLRKIREAQQGESGKASPATS